MRRKSWHIMMQLTERNQFVVGERHNGNANEDKLRRKEAGIRHAKRKRKSTTLSPGYHKYPGKIRGRKTPLDRTDRTDRRG